MSSKTVVLLFIIAVVLFLYIEQKNLSFNMADKVVLNKNDTYVKKFGTKYFNSISVTIVPDGGNLDCELIYYIEGQKTTQAKWVSKEDEIETYTFTNDALGNEYEIRVSPVTSTVTPAIMIKSIKTNVYTNPYNSSISSSNAIQVKEKKIVDNESYAIAAKSVIYDFGEIYKGNIEVNGFCDSTSNPSLSVFGSKTSTESSFVRLGELNFENGSFSALNSKFYVSQLYETSFRYFFIQITEELASGLTVELTRTG
jgi:hypothetical protein